MATPVFNGVRTLYKNYSVHDAQAWTRADCSSCGPNVQMGLVAYRVPDSSSTAIDVEWLVCSSCNSPYMKNGNRLFPSGSALPTPKHMPDDIALAWSEASSCLSVSAFTASAIMLRKILLHLAVDKGLAAEDDKGWSPTFEKAVDYLANNGVIAESMKPWVTKIRTSGNVAAHKLPATDRTEARTLAEFTRQLLVLNYEIPGELEAMD